MKTTSLLGNFNKFRCLTFNTFLGVINIHLDVVIDLNTAKFFLSLDSPDLVQHVVGPTRRGPHARRTHHTFGCQSNDADRRGARAF